MSDVPWDFGDAEMRKKKRKAPSLSITVINDPVHGHMEFHPLVMKVVNTPQFQRLRNLKQLGGSYMVYPGGAHNRFEHCMGVSYLAMKVASTLKLRQPELGIMDQDILCVAIAGLCHDLGHGPFSHTFQDVSEEFQPKPDQKNHKWTHEEASKQMFEHMWEEAELKEEFEWYEMDEKHKKIIKRLITGKPKGDEKAKKGFLYQIVANNKNGIDVDKWDYLARDALNTGMPTCFDHRRLMKFVRAIKHEGEWVLCTRDKEVSNVYEMFKQRHFMYERVYNHKVVKCIEEMIKDALQAAVASGAVKYPGQNGEMKDIFTCTKDMAAYTLLDDSVLNRILTTPSVGLKKDQKKSLEKAKEILQRINKRDLYRCVAETLPVATEVANSAKTKAIAGFKRDGFMVKKSPLSYDKGLGNPVDNMRFYSKHNPAKAIQITKEEVSLFLPSVFAQQTFRLVCTKRAADMDDAFKEFKRECKKIKLDGRRPLKVQRYVK